MRDAAAYLPEPVWQKGLRIAPAFIANGLSKLPLIKNSSARKGPGGNDAHCTPWAPNLRTPLQLHRQGGEVWHWLPRGGRGKEKQCWQLPPASLGKGGRNLLPLVMQVKDRYLHTDGNEGDLLGERKSCSSREEWKSGWVEENMGACMAPAACDTIAQNLYDFDRVPEDYDRIITGDLGYVGQSILFDLMRARHVDIKKNHMDCGMTIFDQNTQDTHAGGSGCGCAAVTLSCLYSSQTGKRRVETYSVRTYRSIDVYGKLQ